jgi:hypothetical protein
LEQARSDYLVHLDNLEKIFPRELGLVASVEFLRVHWTEVELFPFLSQNCEIAFASLEIEF